MHPTKTQSRVVQYYKDPQCPPVYSAHVYDIATFLWDLSRYFRTTIVKECVSSCKSHQPVSTGVCQSIIASTVVHRHDERVKLPQCFVFGTRYNSVSTEISYF